MPERAPRSARAASVGVPPDVALGLLLVLVPPLGVLRLWSSVRDRETKVVTTVVTMMWMTAWTAVALAIALG